MVGTNRQFETLLRHLDGQIAGMERVLVNGAGAGEAAPQLEDLWQKRRALKLLLLNRKIEAAKSIVDFQRWRDGNGALYLCAAACEQPKGRQKARA
jgi:hypothetical protein